MPEDNQTNPMPTPTAATTDVPTQPSADGEATTPLATEPNNFAPSPTIVEPNIPDSNLDQSSAVVQPDAPVDKRNRPPAEVMPEVADKIADSHNILIALSGDPSVDEMCSAIGLSLFLDKLGKRATAIYSGKTPDALDFLEPGKTFEDNPDALQDFVIAINKDKADHLRYKLDGDYVKVYITPYKSKITAEDLEYSYGDYNVDLVLALNVPNGIDLDSALREHGRIMHDASIINITTAKPGKFGEIEWSDRRASSVSEMIATLLLNFGNKVKVEPAEATAFLTGIVAATDHFKKTNTAPATLQIGSRLLEAGANQQLITENITDSLDNQFFSFSPSTGPTHDSSDSTALDIEHEGTSLSAPSSDDSGASTSTPTLQPLGESPAEGSTPAPSIPSLDASDTSSGAPSDSISNDSGASPDSSLLDELKATEASLTGAGAEAVPDLTNQPVRIDDSATSGAEAPTEKVLAPSADFTAEPLSAGTNKYGQMLEDALAEADTMELPDAAPVATPVVAPVVPPASDAPEVPEIDYGPLPGDQVLPPPPTPPIDFNSPLPEPPQTSSADPAATSSPEPSVEAPVATPAGLSPESAGPSTPPSSDAFQIPSLPTV